MNDMPDKLKELEEWATEHLKAISVMEPSDIALATKAVYEQILGKIGELRNQ